VFEYTVGVYRAFFPTGTDVYQELGQDPAHKIWFEEAVVSGSRQRGMRYFDGLIDEENGSDIQLE